MAFDVVITKVADDYEEALRKISDNPFLFHLIVDTISEIFPCFTEWKEQGSLSADSYIQNVIYSTYRWK